MYEIETLRVYVGELPRRVHNLVNEWADLHREELADNARDRIAEGFESDFPKIKNE